MIGTILLGYTAVGSLIAYREMRSLQLAKVRFNPASGMTRGQTLGGGVVIAALWPAYLLAKAGEVR